MFVGASLIPQYYEDKIDLFVALAPVVRMDTVQNTAMKIASKIPSSILEGVIQITHMYNLLPRNPASAGYADFCNALPTLCNAIEQGIAGMNNTLDNEARYADKAAHDPSGTGWRCLIHYAQIINGHKFQRFDFGKSENLKRYGQETPPLYDLSKINIKVALFTGRYDQLADPGDVAWLEDESQSGLQSSQVVFKQQYANDHVTFVMYKDPAYFQDVLKVIGKYASRSEIIE